MNDPAALRGDELARRARATNLLAAAGLWGMLLTVVVLAASVFMRLTTAFDAAGEAVSTLPDAAETFARLAHRIAAMAVSILALLSAFAVVALRPVAPARLAAVGSVLALTVVLAVLGRYTTGYRIPGVTVGNVAGGMALACAFWWLREQALRADAPRRVPLEWAALAILLVQSGLGAAASSSAMRGDFSGIPLHVALGIAAAVVAGLCARDHFTLPTRRLALLLALGTVVQLGIGYGLAIAQPGRPLLAGWLHAVLATALTVGFTALAVRSPSTTNQ
jgi:hypothetical protein